MGHKRTPLAFPHPFQGITDAVCKSCGECIPDELRINLPIDQGIVMDSFHRPVALVMGIKNKQGFRAVEFVHSRKIKAFDSGFLFPFQRMVNHEHVKQQHSQRIQIGLGSGNSLSAHNFRGHETGRSQHANAGLSLGSHIVIVADQHIPGLGIKKHISE